MRPLRLIRYERPEHPAFDPAFARAVLLRVAAGQLPETFRLSVPPAVVAFGRRDVNEPGYPAAVRAARAGGCEAVERLAGGRAAVFHERTFAFSHAIPGEYCPGAHSVNARGERKLMGVGQRVIAGAAHVGGVVVADEVDVEPSDVEEAIVGELSERYDLREDELDPGTIALAEELEPDHLVRPFSERSSA